MNLKSKKIELEQLKSQKVQLLDSFETEEVRNINYEILQLEQQINDHINHSLSKRYRYS